jgi:release factor glutamine methyltransferase
VESINEQEKKWLLTEKFKGQKSTEYFNECKLIEKGMPVAYLIGYVEFLGCHIDLSYKPLIPRAETEYWVDIFIKKNKGNKNLQILDLFSGSGCIGIAVSKHLNIHVDFGDINAKNIEQIKKNIAINTLMEKSNVYVSNIFSDIPRKKYHYILANPPYIDREKISQVQDSVLYNEDNRALFADEQGLQYVYELIDNGWYYLEPEGEIWIEFDSWQVNLVNIYLQDTKKWAHYLIKDQYNRDRVLVLVLN